MPGFSVSWTRAKCSFSCSSRILRPQLRFYATKSQQDGLWSKPETAGFIAAAKTISSIPESTGLPEVCSMNIILNVVNADCAQCLSLQIIVTGRWRSNLSDALECRANVGKSTLLNSVIGRKSLLSTSKKAGHTRALNFYRVGPEPGKLLLVDAPGYGARGRPEWGDLFDHYLKTRQELKRVYILFNAKHGLNAYDTQMLAHLSQFLISPRGTQPFTLQAVITKADTVPIAQLDTALTEMKKAIWDAAPLCLPPLVTSAEMSPPFGLDSPALHFGLPLSVAFEGNPQFRPMVI
ncbi:hypothetical protein CVT26_002332 [Gymnopilus dilepis]|uniref:EngB-type G domain-containing protein n=1 Tax=Gymnopilus dilepis TaxID=231916 RepID=A0A409Y3F9_9AGAR|nr:hypothetical protein CVT26_002332 [Gymnopilus dilepis]